MQGHLKSKLTKEKSIQDLKTQLAEKTAAVVSKNMHFYFAQHILNR